MTRPRMDWHSEAIDLATALEDVRGHLLARDTTTALHVADRALTRHHTPPSERRKPSPLPFSHPEET